MIAKAKIQEQYTRVLEHIGEVARQAGRNPQDVRLVVVTKGHPIEAVQTVVDAGARYLGENYVEEAIPKIQAVSEHADVEWHMIGHVQSRKARAVCRYFEWVHSLDSLKLARRLNQGMEEENLASGGGKLRVLLECNVSGEETKFGFQAWQEENWPALIAEFAEIARLPHLEIRGLMTMAPFLEDAEQTRPYFRRLCRLRDFLSKELPSVDWSELSMGMSADYEVAIQEGATWVRIGTAILGPRL